MNKVVFTIIAVVSILLSIEYNYSIVDNFFTLCVLIFSGRYFGKMKNFGDVFCSLFFLFYIFCSVHIVALFKIMSPGFFKDYISYDEYRSLAIWGNRLFFIILLTQLICNSLHRSRIRKLNYCYVKIGAKDASDRLMIIFLLFVYFLQFFSMALGITDSLGDAAVVLPFHLNGIIDELRTGVCHFVFCLYLYHKFTNNKKIDKRIVVMYLLYAVFQIFVKNSKGAFVFSFIQAIVLLFMMNKVRKYTVTHVFLPLLLFFLVTYPIVESARISGQLTVDSLIETTKGTTNGNYKLADDEKSNPYVRVFLTGVYYTKCIHEVDPDQTSFDFSRIPAIVLMKGGVAYMTRVIDGLPDTSHHSSGVTGLCDALLWGGYPMCYIIVIMLALLSYWGDNAKILIEKPLYRVVFFMFFYSRIVASSISFLIDPLFLSVIGTIAIKVIIVKFYYRHDANRVSIKKL